MNPESNTGLYWSDESVDIHQLHDTRRNNQQDENDLPNTMVKIADLQADPAVHLTTDGNCPDGPKESHACCKVADPVGVWQQKRNPLVAICSGVTSRGIPKKDQHTNKLALFVHLLPSIVRTYDCDVDYLMVIAFDKGDEFYDNEEGQTELKNWLLQNLAIPMGERGVSIKFMLVEVENEKKKPGPVFNAMLREAYHAGADYFYRLNDDTELTSGGNSGTEDKWSKTFIKSLQVLGPPFGVIGPSHEKGNLKILTHDFVHRSHMDIFHGVYYDPFFTDWWMDDYISFLYGRNRTIKSTKFMVNHHSGHHGGKRYEVHDDKTHQIPVAVKEGREKIELWMRKSISDVDEASIKSLMLAEQGPPYRDVPDF